MQEHLYMYHISFIGCVKGYCGDIGTVRVLLSLLQVV